MGLYASNDSHSDFGLFVATNFIGEMSRMESVFQGLLRLKFQTFVGDIFTSIWGRCLEMD